MSSSRTRIDHAAAGLGDESAPRVTPVLSGPNGSLDLELDPTRGVAAAPLDLDHARALRDFHEDHRLPVECDLVALAGEFGRPRVAAPRDRRRPIARRSTRGPSPHGGPPARPRRGAGGSSPPRSAPSAPSRRRARPGSTPGVQKACSHASRRVTPDPGAGHGVGRERHAARSDTDRDPVDLRGNDGRHRTPTLIEIHKIQRLHVRAQGGAARPIHPGSRAWCLSIGAPRPIRGRAVRAPQS